MIEAGYAESVSDAFDRYLGDGKPAYIASERKPTPVEAIRLIRAAGGLRHLLGGRGLGPGAYGNGAG